jgi:hypothetical protein
MEVSESIEQIKSILEENGPSCQPSSIPEMTNSVCNNIEVV